MWSTTTIAKSSYLRGRIGWQGLKASEFIEDGPYLITGTDFVGGRVNWDTCYHVTEERYAEGEYIHVMDGDVLITKDGTIGKVALVDNCLPKAVLNSGIFLLRCDDGSYDHRFMFHLLSSRLFSKFLDDNLAGSTINHLYQYIFECFEFPVPSNGEQTKIATILSTIDKTIEQTEVIIAKQQRIKTGLMQDLLTRGIDEHGNLRSEETHEFKDSPLGRIPVEWDIETLGNLVESAVDGPFGSNLKTEHYVSEPGVRVLRLQNIGNGEFFDFDKAWVSSLHAKKLTRYSVIAGDILVASLGDERHPFCRACLYPDTAQPAIVKADVFRIRCNQKMISHSFIFRLFNMPRWRGPLLGLAQGVTRDRVNLSNLMLLPLPVPDFDEQKALARRLDSVDNSLVNFRISREKLRRQKTALMQDLLTGKVRVTPLLDHPHPA